MIRHGWIGVHADITQKRQCVLAGVSRTTVYAKRPHQSLGNLTPQEVHKTSSGGGAMIVE